MDTFDVQPSLSRFQKYRTYYRTYMKFYLKESAGESHLIMGKLYDSQFHDGRFVYSTGEKIKKGQWTKQDMPKKGMEDLSERLLEIRKQATTYIRLNRSNLTKEGLKAHLDGLRPKEQKPVMVNAPQETATPTLLEYWKQFVGSVANTVEEKTAGIYRNSMESMEAFLIKKKWETMAPQKFTVIHLNEYHGYLKSAYKPNTVAKRLKHLKAFLTHLQDDLKLPLGLEIRKIKYKETAGLKISLSEDQLQAYIDANDLPPHLVKVRDLAVIQASTGLRVSDRKRIDRNITENKIVIETKKTKTRVEILITPTVRAILEKYGNQLPQLSDQNYNEGIKAIHKILFEKQTIQVREGKTFKDVPVHEEISSHDMVRTFITLSAERGMPVNVIAKITGKSVATLLKNYLVESQKVADKEMEKVWGYAPLKVAK